jgi:hypothetical protein
MSTSRFRRVAIETARGLAIAALPIALVAAWLLLRGPGAERDARHFGQSVHAVISGGDLKSWAERMAAIPRPGPATKTDIPRADWPPELRTLLERDTFATATFWRNHMGVATGISFRDGLVGIVIPLNGTIPDAGYFSIHMIDETLSWYAYSRY